MPRRRRMGLGYCSTRRLKLQTLGLKAIGTMKASAGLLAVRLLVSHIHPGRHCRPPHPPLLLVAERGIDMSCNMFPRFYDQLVDEDIEWLKTNAPGSLERDHLLAVLEFSKREYRLRGYDEAMSKTGPHYQKDPS